jgi:hypothetical protein
MSPIADAYTSSPDEFSDRYPLEVAVCEKCYLVQLLEILDQKTLFGTGYSFYSSASRPLSIYHERYAHEVIRTHGYRTGRPVVEIGCNDGDMLQHFDRAGYTTIGVDPAEGPAEKAMGRGLCVIMEPFTQQVAARIVDDYGQAGVVIANHVLAHVESVTETLAGIGELLHDDGVALVEVQYLPDLLVNNAFDLVYHEHRNFFSLSSLQTATKRWGLWPQDVKLTDRQGGSLRVVLRPHRGRPSARVEALLAAEQWLRTPDAYAGLQGRAERLRARLRDLLGERIAMTDRIVGYGAPAKATTLLNFCGITDVWVKKIYDTTEAKQGRYVPGTGIKIEKPPTYTEMDGIDTVLLLAWNYAETIMRRHVSFTQRGGRWIVPVPAPTLL